MKNRSNKKWALRALRNARTLAAAKTDPAEKAATLLRGVKTAASWLDGTHPKAVNDRTYLESMTPLGDALAIVDHKQNRYGGNLPTVAELTALRTLAEAVRLHCSRHPEMDMLTLESTAAELWDNMSEEDTATAVRSYLGARQVEVLDKMSAKHAEPGEDL